MKHDNLYIACVSRRPASSAIKRLLAAGADPNAPAIARYGDTPLMAACRAGHIEVVKLLLAAGADPLYYNRFWETPADLADGELRKILRDAEEQALHDVEE